MTLEEAKSILEQEKRLCVLYGRSQFVGNIEAIDTVLQALDNSISKDDIKLKYEDYKERIRYYDDNNIKQDDIYHEYIAICDVLVELLGE